MHEQLVTLPEIFQSIAEQYPNNIAITHNDKQISYGALARRANRISGWLRDFLPHSGTSAEMSPIAIYLPSGIDFVCAMLAINNCGYAYLPLDLKYPAARIQEIISQTGCPLVLTCLPQLSSFPDVPCSVVAIDKTELFAPYSELSFPSPAKPQDMAYIIFTSGSTGVPKGLGIRHQNIINTLRWTWDYFAMQAGENGAQVARVVFDASVWEFWTNLLLGNHLHIIDEAVLLDMPALKQIVSEAELNYLFLPTPVAELFMNEELDESSPLKWLWVGGDRLLQRPSPHFCPRVANLYGPAECAVICSCSEVSPSPRDTAPNIGKPVSNCQIYIMDEQLQALPHGAKGEICIAGACVGSGYFHAPELTAKAFIPNFLNQGQGILYRSGDLGRYNADGNLECLGRIDSQVKIRGFRIELEEIEAVLHSHPGLREVIVLAEGETEDKDLYAYYLCSVDESPDEADLQALAKAKLPEYMVPRHYIRLEEFPLTANGKIDRRALPRLKPGIESPEETELPVSELELTLAGIWSEVLKTPQIKLSDRFYQLGGHSIKAAQLKGLLLGKLGLNINIGALLSNPSLAEFTHLVSTIQSGQTNLAVEIIPTFQDSYPLAYAQQGLWYYWHLEPNRRDYIIPIRFDIKGRINPEILLQAILYLQERHTVLRSGFRVQEGIPEQFFRKEQEICFEHHIISESSEHVQMLSTDKPLGEAQELYPYPAYTSKVAELESRMRNTAFDLAKDPLYRVCLLEFSSERSVLLFSIHHIICDGWSMGLWQRELCHVYSALASEVQPRMRPLGINYGDFCLWQQQHDARTLYPEQLEFWRKQLSPLPPKLNLPERLSPISNDEPQGKRLWWKLDAKLTAQLMQQSQAEGNSLFATLLAMFKLIIAAHCSMDDIVIGSSSAGRELPQTRDMVGLLTNLFLIRSQVLPQLSLAEFVARENSACSLALQNSEFPYEQLLHELFPHQELARQALSSVMFIMQNFPQEPDRDSDIQLSMREIGNHTAKFDLLLTIEEDADELLCWFEYKSAVWEDSQLERMARQFTRLCRIYCTSSNTLVQDIDILLPEERELLLHDFIATEKDYPSLLSYPQIWQLNLPLYAQRTALVCADGSYSYQQLDSLANQLAAYLSSSAMEHPAKAGEIIGICLPRGLWLAASMLAIWKLGAAYLPLDPDYPMQRLLYMQHDAGLKLILGDSSTEAVFSTVLAANFICLDKAAMAIQTLSDKPLENIVFNPSDLAYLIYTSGSTGQPKGVQISHQNLLNHNHAVMDLFQLSSADKVMQFGALSFDLSVEEIFPTWLSGASLVMRTEAVLSSLDGFLDFVEQHEISVIDIPTAYWHLLVHHLSYRTMPSCLRLCIIGGEAAQPDKLLLWQKYTAAGLRLINTYGPTETTIIATAHEVLKGEDHSHFPIGKPIANYRTYVLDNALRPVPLGAVGELYIAGAGLSSGYLNQHELTSQKFLPDPFAMQEDALMYRSGDLARYSDSGELYFLGRADEQVKLLGHRIELGEIEAQLRQNPLVLDALVVLQHSSKEDEDDAPQYLCAYVISMSDSLDTTELRHWLKQYLPDYLIPAHILSINSFPLGPQGKVDKQKLPKPKLEGSPEAITLPRTKLEKELASIYCGVLQLGQLDVFKSFHELGGHSLKAILALSRIEKDLGLAISLKEFWHSSSVAALAKILESKRIMPVADYLPEPVFSRKITQSLPLSFAQEGLWYLWEIDPTRKAYNIPLCYEFKGYIKPDLLSQALLHVLGSYDVFSMHLAETASLPELHLDVPVPTSIKVNDFSKHPLPLAEGMARQAAERLAETRFDLFHGPLYATELIKIREDNWLLVFVVHHIIADGWALANLSKILSQSYKALLVDAELPLPEYQYKDYIFSQNSAAYKAMQQQQMDYWKQKLNPLPPALALPLKAPRPAFQSFEGEQIHFVINHEDTAMCVQTAQRYEVGLFSLLLASTGILLYRYTGQDELIIGTPFANRSRHFCEEIVGCFTNMLPLCINIDPHESFLSYLQRVHETTLEAFSHGQFPFHKMPALTNAPRDTSRHQIYQTMLTLQNYPIPALDFTAATVRPTLLANHSSKLDVGFDFATQNGSIEAVMDYCSDLISSDIAQRMVLNLQEIMRSVCQKPQQEIGQINYLHSAELQLIKPDFSLSKRNYPEQDTAISHLSSALRKGTNNIAIFYDKQELSYTDLMQMVGIFRYTLAEQGIKDGSCIALCLHRQPELIALCLAIWQLRACYFYLDPEFPDLRLRDMTELAEPQLIISQSSLNERISLLPGKHLLLEDMALDKLPGEMKEPVSGLAEDTAYLIFTSGSTGKPKAVAISQGSLVNFLLSMREIFALDAHDSLAAITPLSFDISILELFLPLLCGAKLILVPRSTALDGSALAELIAKQQVSIFQATPSTYKLLLDSGWEGQPRLRCLCGGEALSQPLAKQIFPRVAQLWNMYGPTETTVWSSCYQILDPEEPIHLGYPIANTSFYLLDSHLSLVPCGCPGELYIGGKGVAKGYLNNPVLSAKAFIPSPFVPGDVLYKTGDLLRYTASGQLIYLGRTDFQVKIRGHRIEPGEIASAICLYPAVKDAVLSSNRDQWDQPRLNAYLIWKEAEDLAGLKLFLANMLPDYMLPAAYMNLTSFPQTPNGKTDIKALPEIISTPTSQKESDYQGFYTPEQEIICNAIADILHLERVGIKDNFFDLGGNSILSMQLIQKLKHAGLQVGVDILFRSNNIEDLAAQLSLQSADKQTFGHFCLVELKKGKQGNAPLFLIHPLPGDVLGYVNLVHKLASEQPVYGIQALGLVQPDKAHTSIKAMAAYYLRIISKMNLNNGYYLAGWCFGGTVAIEMAQQLYASELPVPPVILFDTWAFNPVNSLKTAYQIHRLKQMLLSWRRIPHLLKSKLKDRGGFALVLDQETVFQDQGIFKNRSLVRRTNLASIYGWKLQRFPGKLLVFKAKEQHPDMIHDWTLGWKLFAPQARILDINATHENILKEPQVDQVVALLNKFLQKEF